MNWLIVIITGLGALVILCGLGAVLAVINGTPPQDRPAGPVEQDRVDTDSDNMEHPPPDDVEITRCDRGEWGWIEVELEVTNHTAEPSDYSITVEVLTGRGQRVDQVYAFTNHLRPDQRQRLEVGGLQDLAEYRSVECRLLEVDRWASP